ncbi:MAG: hypothetical protein IPK00_15475 [Deltaproteobacteria bacterium]|nr:hypothetical protein [Deltaproteobacteria bacterium]
MAVRSRLLVLALALVPALALGLARIIVPWDGPVGPLPGGRLRGVDQPCPTSWAAFADERAVELEVGPASPRSVRIWNVVDDGRLFVPGDFLTPIKRWPQRVVADPRVRIRIAGEVFRCRAQRVDESEAIARLRLAIGRKYDLAPDGWAARSEVWFFELVPRPEDAAFTAPTAGSEPASTRRPRTKPAAAEPSTPAAR